MSTSSLGSLGLSSTSGQESHIQINPVFNVHPSRSTGQNRLSRKRARFADRGEAAVDLSSDEVAFLNQEMEREAEAERIFRQLQRERTEANRLKAQQRLSITKKRKAAEAKLRTNLLRKKESAVRAVLRQCELPANVPIGAEELRRQRLHQYLQQSDLPFNISKLPAHWQKKLTDKVKGRDTGSGGARHNRWNMYAFLFYNGVEPKKALEIITMGDVSLAGNPIFPDVYDADAKRDMEHFTSKKNHDKLRSSNIKVFDVNQGRVVPYNN